MNKKVLIVATVQSHIAQFHKPYIKQLQMMGYEVHIAGKNNLREKNGLKLEEPDKCIPIDFERNPFSLSNLDCAKQLRKLIDKELYGLVICNTPIIGVYTRIICRKRRKYNGIKVMYIAHGFHFYKGSSLKNWLLYFPIEWALAPLTDVIVTINKEDYNLAKKWFKAKQVEYITGIGVDTDKYRLANKSDTIRSELGIPEESIFLFSIGELYPRKNHKVIINALGKLKREDLYYVICGNGILYEELQDLCKKNNIQDKVVFAGYRTDIPVILKSADIFCFPSVREGLGLAGIEAMSSGLPLITSNITGINDYMVQGKTGFVCSPHYVEQFANAIELLADNETLRQQIGLHNLEASKKFDVENSLKIMKDIFMSVGVK